MSEANKLGPDTKKGKRAKQSPEGAEISKAISERRALKKSRRCHDCGKPTADYRCAACWAKIRSGTENRTDGDYAYA